MGRDVSQKIFSIEEMSAPLYIHKGVPELLYFLLYNTSIYADKYVRRETSLSKLRNRT